MTLEASAVTGPESIAVTPVRSNPTARVPPLCTLWMTSADDRSTSNVYLPLLLSVTLMVPHLGVQGTPMLLLLTKNTVALTGVAPSTMPSAAAPARSGRDLNFNITAHSPFSHKNDGATLGPAWSAL